MASVYESELKAQEVQIMHFGFSPIGFTDQVYNLALECWTHVVEDVLMKEPLLKEAKDKKKLQRSLVDMIFFPSFMDIFTSFKDYVLRHVFRIPATVTLPVHQEIHKLTAEMVANGEVYDVAREETRIKKVEKRILKKKAVIAELDTQIAEADACIEELEHMIKMARELKGLEPTAAQ